MLKQTIRAAQRHMRVSDPSLPQKSRALVIRFALWHLMLSAIVSLPVNAHEYWLDPVGTRWAVGEGLSVDIRNGEDFVGIALPFDPNRLQRGELISPTNRQRLRGRLGDYPAIQFTLEEPGLHAVLFDTTRRELKYDDPDAFENFLNYHAFTDVLARHRQHGLAEAIIVEHYYRYSKALVTVSPDELAVKTQSSAHETPSAVPSYSNAENFENEPLAERQIELFYRNTKQQSTRHTVRSDVNGRATFNVSADGDYLINSVTLLEPDQRQNVEWISLWTTLFFQQSNQ